jgi:hypothetical protein
MSHARSKRAGALIPIIMIGAPVAPGDLVKVDGRHGIQSAHVVSISDEPPPFETKAVLGLADAPPEDPAPADPAPKLMF